MPDSTSSSGRHDEYDELVKQIRATRRGNREERDKVWALLAATPPPKEPLARARARDALAIALIGHVRAPAAVADAWLASGKEAQR